MKAKLTQITLTTLAIAGAFLIGKFTTPTEKTVIAQLPTENISTEDYISLTDIESTTYDESENKITISTITDNYDFKPTVINAKSNADDIYEIYDSKDLTEDILTNRQGKIIIEKCVGIVIDDEKNGELVNEDSEYNYISYENVDCEKGDIITTYLIYNPETNYTDDVIYRYDIVNAN